MALQRAGSTHHAGPLVERLERRGESGRAFRFVGRYAKLVFPRGNRVEVYLRKRKDNQTQLIGTLRVKNSSS
jgi:hypothetical protein